MQGLDLKAKLIGHGLRGSSPFLSFLDAGPSFSSQTFLRFSISPFLIVSTPFRVSSGMTEVTPYRSAIGFLTIQGEATAASRSTQSRMKRRRIDLEKVRRSRLETRFSVRRTLVTTWLNEPHLTTLNLH